MSAPKKNLNKEILALFSGQASIITTPKLYIQLTHSHCLASVLNQIVYWSNKSKLKDEWFYKTYEEWYEEINIPERSLRRYLRILEQNNWAETKVKKINDKNILHIRPNINAIIDSISSMLNADCPIRPTCPVGIEFEHNCCTEIAPSGQVGRSETAKLAGSTIYTEDNIQITTTTVPTPPVDNLSSSSSFFSEKQKDELLSYKLPTDERSTELFLENCEHHVGQQDNDLSKYQRFTGLIKILIGCYERQEHFKATGFKKNVTSTATIHRIPTKQDIEDYRNCVPGTEWVGAHRKIQ